MSLTTKPGSPSEPATSRFGSPDPRVTTTLPRASLSTGSPASRERTKAAASSSRPAPAVVRRKARSSSPRPAPGMDGVGGAAASRKTRRGSKERWRTNLPPTKALGCGGRIPSMATILTPAAATATPRTVRAPRGSAISCRGWQQEAALRMLMNNLDPEVAERPEDLVVYGGSGKAARNWECFEAIVATLQRLGNDETLLVQSGKPVAVFRTHEEAPRVLIANSLLVPHWATADEFRRLEGLGLTMYGQMTAGSWIYIGTQGILQGTYETFAAAAKKHFGGDLKGKLVVSGGMGGMGGAQPLAVTMNEGVCLVAEVDRHRIERRLVTRYLDEVAPDVEAGWRGHSRRAT